MAHTYDVVVIGAGSGGLTAASGFAKVGKKVLLVEKEHMGGECTNSGCIPSKALLHHAKAYHATHSLAGSTSTTETYRKNALAYVQEKINHILASETPEIFHKKGIDVVMGEAVFTDKCSVSVDGVTYRFKKAVIATGSSPRHIDIPGLAPEDTLTNQNLFELEEIPKQLLIIGSGPIGMEMGQAFAFLGSHVTIATIDAEFARLEDPAIRPIIKKVFTDLGVTIETRAFISAVENGKAIFNRKDGDTITGTFSVPFDNVLLAIGRVPNIPDGLDKANIKADKACIMIDSQYRTSNKYVYALGDVAQKLQFTHTADDAARQVVTRVTARGWLRVNRHKAVPKVTYTQPEIAQVGLSYDAALKKYNAAEIMRIDVPYEDNDRAHTDSATAGTLVVIARRVNGAVLGAHMIGPAAGELISIFTLAIDRRISLWKLRSLIYPYPTYSLLIKKAGDLFFAQQIADIKPDLIHLLKKHLPKIIALIFWSILLYQFQHYKAVNNLSYQDMLMQLYEFFTMSMYGPLIYVGLYAVRPLIFFPATLLTALSGALFGFWWGVIYTVFGENASANFAYWIGRFFGKDLKLEDSIIGNWVEALRKRPFEAVLFMRLFYFPFDLTNYGSGILRVKWPAYFLATVIGIMPGLTTFVALGAAVDLEEFHTNGISFNVLDPIFIGLSVAIFIASLMLSRILKRWKAEM